jgi:hypothetical protein
MKFNWGTGIFLFLLLFVGAILTFVFFAFSQDVNLVNKEYYQKGVTFDEERAKKERAEKVKDKIEIIQDDTAVTIRFEDAYYAGVKDAQAHYYRPSDRHKDLKIKFDNNPLSVSKSDFIHGKYTLFLTWEYEGELYNYEKYIFIK